jgi:hypothetical protein
MVNSHYIHLSGKNIKLAESSRSAKAFHVQSQLILTDEWEGFR